MSKPKMVTTEVRFPVGLANQLRMKGARLGMSMEDYAAHLVVRGMDDYYTSRDALALNPPQPIAKREPRRINSE